MTEAAPRALPPARCLALPHRHLERADIDGRRRRRESRRTRAQRPRHPRGEPPLHPTRHPERAALERSVNALRLVRSRGSPPRMAQNHHLHPRRRAWNIVARRRLDARSSRAGARMAQRTSGTLQHEQLDRQGSLEPGAGWTSPASRCTKNQNARYQTAGRDVVGRLSDRQSAPSGTTRITQPHHGHGGAARAAGGATHGDEGELQQRQFSVLADQPLGGKDAAMGAGVAGQQPEPTRRGFADTADPRLTIGVLSAHART